MTEPKTTIYQPVEGEIPTHAPGAVLAIDDDTGLPYDPFDKALVEAMGCKFTPRRPRFEED